MIRKPRLSLRMLKLYRYLFDYYNEVCIINTINDNYIIVADK